MAPDGEGPLQIEVVNRDTTLARLQVICTGQVARRVEGSDNFIELPGLCLLVRGQKRQMDALLCLNQRDGYATKLYLAEQVPELGRPWSNFYILGKNWFSWSWKEVAANQSPIAILAGHLEAFQ